MAAEAEIATKQRCGSKNSTKRGRKTKGEGSCTNFVQVCSFTPHLKSYTEKSTTYIIFKETYDVTDM